MLDTLTTILTDDEERTAITAGDVVATMNRVMPVCVKGVPVQMLGALDVRTSPGVRRPLPLVAWVGIDPADRTRMICGTATDLTVTIEGDDVDPHAGGADTVAEGVLNVLASLVADHSDRLTWLEVAA